MAKLNEKLQANGFDGLSFVRNGVRATISESFTAVFDCAALESWERKLLRLIAMLPYIFYLPTDLAPLAMDVTVDQDELCDYLHLLADPECPGLPDAPRHCRNAAAHPCLL
ncbi:MAG: hypothetical protein IKK21_08635 [Clostridia bacterium]|nr:hypothetical protein [Clostridia bacterium]